MGGRLICALEDLPEGGCRGFALMRGERPVHGLVVRVNGEVRGYVNRCPHAGQPLNLLPHQFLSPDGSVIVCAAHGALFEKRSGYCLLGPCAGRSLTKLPLAIEDGYVVLEVPSAGVEQVDVIE